MSAPDVFSSCSFIPCAHFETSSVMAVAMFTRYDVISNTMRWSSHLWVKIHVFFKILSTMKVNLVAKIMQSAYLCVISHVKHKKLLFLILGKIQERGQDRDHWW